MNKQVETDVKRKKVFLNEKTLSTNNRMSKEKSVWCFFFVCYVINLIDLKLLECCDKYDKSLKKSSKKKFSSKKIIETVNSCFPLAFFSSFYRVSCQIFQKISIKSGKKNENLFSSLSFIELPNFKCPELKI